MQRKCRWAPEIEEKARKYYNLIAKQSGNHDCAECAEAGFKAGVEFAQQWISVEDEIPLEISTDKKDINGNGFTQYISYIVKGYFDSKGKPEAVKIAWFRPFVTKWDFRFDKKEYEPEFIITHWRPININ